MPARGSGLWGEIEDNGDRIMVGRSVSQWAGRSVSYRPRRRKPGGGSNSTMAWKMPRGTASCGWASAMQVKMR